MALVTLLSFPVALLAAESPLVAQSMRNRSGLVGWYFQSGQWRADIRTLKAAASFLLDAEAETTTPVDVIK